MIKLTFFQSFLPCLFFKLWHSFAKQHLQGKSSMNTSKKEAALVETKEEDSASLSPWSTHPRALD